jgi:hypothetical protein
MTQTAPAPRPDVAREFLARYRPAGPWVLTATDPIETRTLDTLEDLPAFLEEFNAPGRNVYFHVNELTTRLHGKHVRAKKSDVARVPWLHVDVDPYVAEELRGRLAEEQARILKLMEKLPGDLPRPTAVVFSGGGYQAYWRLDEPLMVDGEQARWEHAERYTRQVQTLLRTEDSCFNVDRIMRIPGSVNWPNEKKQKKGRVPTVAEVVWFEDTAYPIDRFVPAVDVGSKGESLFASAAPVVEAPTNVERVSDLATLPCVDHVKRLIVHGTDPEEPEKYPSRSEALFAAVCGMVRAEVSEETIYAIITDPDWKISESVLVDGNGRRRVGKNLERYALRQIGRAKEKKEEAVERVGGYLEEMNERHAVVGNLGGECLVIERVYNEATRRYEVAKQSWAALGHRYANKFVTDTSPSGKMTETPLVDWWRAHPRRRYYERMVFAPGRDTPAEVLNLWQGFGVDAVPGNCDRFLAHVRHNVCSGDEDVFVYVMKWLARAVQQLDEPGLTALVLRGEQGTGKTFFADTVGHLFGQHYVPIADAEHLVGRFNSHLRDCKVLFADEAFYAGDRKHESVLKALVTSRTKIQELKGVDQEVVANFKVLIMASNSEWVVPAGLKERRFVVLDVSDRRRENHRYFERIKEQLDSGGYEALLHLLLNVDLEGFEVRKIPQTAGLQDQKVLSMAPLMSWWHEKLERGSFSTESPGWDRRILAAELFDDFMEWAGRSGSRRRATEMEVARFLRRAAPSTRRIQLAGDHAVTLNGRQHLLRRPRAYELPDLDECRAIWDVSFGGPYPWPVEATYEEVVAEVVEKYAHDPT